MSSENPGLLESQSSGVVDEEEGLSTSSFSGRGFLCVLGAFTGILGTAGLLGSFGTFQAWYGHNQLSNKSPSAISWIGSLQMCTFFLVSWLAGRLFDVYGPRVLMFVGTGFSLLSLSATSFARTYPEFLLTHGVLLGLGAAFMYRPCVLSVPTHFTKYKVTAVGIAFAGNSVGGTFFPIFIHKLLENVGFDITLRILGLICLVCCSFALVTVSSKGDHTGLGKESLMNLDTVDTNFVIIAVGSAFISLGVFVPFTFIVEYTYTSRLITMSPYVLSVMNGGSTLGRILSALLSDIYGRFNLMIATTLFAGICCLSLWLPATTMTTDTDDGSHSKQATLAITFVIVYGVLSGGFVPLVSSCILLISEKGQEGNRTGLLGTILTIPTLVGGPISGAILATSHRNKFFYVAVFCGVCQIFGSLVILYAKIRMSCGRVITA